MIALSKTHRAILLALTIDRRHYVTLHETDTYPRRLIDRASHFYGDTLPDGAFRAALDKLVDIGYVKQHDVHANRYAVTADAEEYLYNAIS